MATIAGGLSSALGVVFVMIAAAYARREIIENREAAALDAFLAYMKTILDNHQFDEPDFDEISQDSDLYTKYRRYVGYAFTACERVLLYGRGQDYWANTVLHHVRRHRRYISTPLFDGYLDHYSPEMRKILVDVRAETRREIAAAAA